MAESKIARQKSLLKTLWTNPDATQTFGGQTISVDVSNYDVLIIWFQRTNSGLILSPFIVNVNDVIASNESCCMSDIIDLGGHLGRRVFKVYTDNIVFENGNAYGSTYGGGATENNTVLVPKTILGYKA